MLCTGAYILPSLEPGSPPLHAKLILSTEDKWKESLEDFDHVLDIDDDSWNSKPCPWNVIINLHLPGYLPPFHKINFVWGGESLVWGYILPSLSVILCSEGQTIRVKFQGGCRDLHYSLPEDTELHNNCTGICFWLADFNTPFLKN